MYIGAAALSIGEAKGVGLTVTTNILDRHTKAIIGAESRNLSEDLFASGVGIDSDSRINLGYQHGFADGDRVAYTSGGDLNIDGLKDAQTYVVGDADGQTLRLGRTSNEFIETFTPTASNVDVAADVIDLGYEHHFQLGDAVIYRVGDAATVIGGLTDGEMYYVIPVGTTKIALAPTLRDSLRENEHVFEPQHFLYDETDEISFPFDHEFTTGDAVRYENGGGKNITGLVGGQIYFVSVVDERTIQLTSTKANAELGENLLSIGLDGEQGANHSFHPAIDPTTAIDLSNDTIDLGYQHGLSTGQNPGRHPDQ